ncbi:hypothetical protein E1289_01920 [Actinomadura sp. 6K520]|nr:hypothetical protein E1289_01920 [Actinomadura sp. 6K520]
MGVRQRRGRRQGRDHRRQYLHRRSTSSPHSGVASGRAPTAFLGPGRGGQGEIGTAPRGMGGEPTPGRIGGPGGRAAGAYRV